MTTSPPPEPLNGKRIVLGVAGGVAAYKSVELCRRMMDAGAFVSPILTQNATRFVGAATFSAVASEPARVTLWDSPEPSPHTTLGQQADLIVIAPATARVIAAYAHGLADDLLTTTLLATRAPVVICPAMHTEMWEQPAVQANIALLRSRGVTIVEPESGHLAGGDQGVGRLADPARIYDVVANLVSISPWGQPKVRQVRGDLAGKTVLVTSGGTREPIDPVRFISNRSSGKQGAAVAQEAVERGARVILVTAAASVSGVNSISVDTAAEMHEAVMRYLPEADIVVMAAAVADFRPVTAFDQKIKKQQGVSELKLEPTVDILGAIADKRTQGQVIVGFAAETGTLESNALEKLNRKKLDMIVANDVTEEGAGFGHDSNRAIILDKHGRKYDTGLVSKRTVAANLLNQAMELLNERSRDN